MGIAPVYSCYSWSLILVSDFVSNELYFVNFANYLRLFSLFTFAFVWTVSVCRIGTPLSLAVVVALSGRCLAIVAEVTRRCMAVVWVLSGHCLANVWRLFGY